MAAGAAVVLALLVFEHAHLGFAATLHDRGRHLRLVEGGRAHARSGLTGNEEDLAERDCFAGPRLEPLEVEDLTLLDPVLLAAGPDDRVHRTSLLTSGPLKRKTLARADGRVNGERS